MLENKRWRKLIYDEEKLDELIRENYIHIYKYCFYHLGDKETAEDITQDVFLKFLRGLEDYYEYGKLKNYLYVVAKNTMKDYFRKARNTENDNAEKCYDGGLEEIPQRLDILQALNSLDMSDKELIILRYYQELKLRDIARIMNLPMSTVRYKLNNAEKLIKKKLGEMRYDR